MKDFLRKLIPICVFVAAVGLVTLAVLTFSPLFVAVPLAVFCAIAGRALLGSAPEHGDASLFEFVEDVTLVPRPGDGLR